MTVNLKAMQKTLEAKLNEAQAALGQRDGIVIEQTADPVDTLQQAAERELVTQNLNRNAKLARQIRAALDRVQEGTYGICLDCEEEISPKRLSAVPWAELCVRCQENADRASREGEKVILLAA